MPYEPTIWVDGSEPSITATRLNNIEQGIDQAHELLDTVTSAATADALVKRDSAGRTKFAQGTEDGDAVVIPVPVTALKRAQGSSSSSAFNVHQYAFLSVQTSGNSGLYDYQRGAVVAGYRPGEDTATRRMMATIRSGSSSTGRIADWNIGTITWDYLTASGHPRVWAEVDEQGNIIALWEAEDPADPNFPDEEPFEPQAGKLVRLSLPDEGLITAVTQRVGSAPRGQWLTKSALAQLGEPGRIQGALFSDECRQRGLEVPDDPRAVYSEISDEDTRHWYVQLWLRQASRLVHDHRPSTLIPLYREMFRVDAATGLLKLK